jgi:hypothetical protein
MTHTSTPLSFRQWSAKSAVKRHQVVTDHWQRNTKRGKLSKEEEMSEKKLEPCSMNDATHVEIGGKVYKIGDYAVRAFWNSTKSERVGVNIIVDGYDQRTIRQDLFPILGIQPLKEVKPEPIEFEAVFVKHDGQWRQLLTIDDGISIQNCKVARFRCVQILEEKK